MSRSVRPTPYTRISFLYVPDTLGQSEALTPRRTDWDRLELYPTPNTLGQQPGAFEQFPGFIAQFRVDKCLFDER